MTTPTIPLPDDLRLKFVHAGVDRTLNKHPQVQLAVRRGQMTVAAALMEPWYLRAKIGGNKERTFKLSPKDKDAIRGAKDKLNGAVAEPEAFAEYLAQRDARRGVTIGQLHADWLAAGLPFSKTNPRTPEAAARLKTVITPAIEWWSSKIVTAIDHAVIDDFVVYRRGNHRQGPRYTGSRTADLQLAALSSLCQWAGRVGKITDNPFATRPKFATDVRHCHEAMPDNDQQLHKILSWFFAGDREQIICGAWLSLCALTGLRPGEPGFLLRQSAATEFPDLRSAQPGLVYPMPDGTRRMKVQRLKRGQNPAVAIHPALDHFLRTWNTWLARHCPLRDEQSKLFPEITQDRVNDLLTEACEQLKLRQMKPHGFGRAYFVRVRRSQGIDDTTIAVELGQSANSKLIRSVYGDPLDPVGGNLHDWLPIENNQPILPAWDVLSSTEQSNIIAL